MKPNPLLRVVEAIVLLGIAIAFLAPLTTSEDESSALPFNPSPFWVAMLSGASSRLPLNEPQWEYSLDRVRRRKFGWDGKFCFLLVVPSSEPASQLRERSRR